MLTASADKAGMSVTPSHFDVVARLMDATAMRQRVIGQNVANVNTPGYQRSEVSFEDQLKKMLDDGDVDLTSLDPQVLTTRGLTNRSDGNNVDIDIEMGQLSKNELLFETYSQILAAQLGMVRAAISGRA